jgi:hypothetical protein
LIQSEAVEGVWVLNYKFFPSLCVVITDGNDPASRLVIGIPSKFDTRTSASDHEKTSGGICIDFIFWVGVYPFGALKFAVFIDSPVDAISGS